MTQILNITRTDEGQFEIVNATGKLVEGPFETNAAAWKALERIDNGAAHPARAKRKKQRKKEKRKEEQRIKRNAGKAPVWVRTIAAVKFDTAAVRKHRDHKLGKFGAASEVKQIDPVEYLAEKAARGEC